jgi:hypothetical protein
MILVPLFDLKFLNAFAMTDEQLQIGGTSMQPQSGLSLLARRFAVPVFCKPI